MIERRFFFVHVQKTAGTALLRRMKSYFGPERSTRTTPTGTIPDVALVHEQLAERFAARRDEIQVITGHFPLAVTELLRADFTTLTVLREPVERTLSYLRHHRVLLTEDRDVPLEEIYEDPFRYHGLVHNHMVKMFALTPATMTAGALTHVEFEPHHLELAKERLATVDVVGVQERFEEFCAELERRFGWDLGPPIFANRTKPVEVATRSGPASPRTTPSTWSCSSSPATNSPPEPPILRAVLSEIWREVHAETERVTRRSGPGPRDRSTGRRTRTRWRSGCGSSPRRPRCGAGRARRR